MADGVGGAYQVYQDGFYNAKVTLRQNFNVINTIKAALTNDQWSMFLDSPFRPWLDVQCTNGDGLYIHMGLLHERRENVLDDTLWYQFGRSLYRFGRREFCLIIGLSFGRYPNYRRLGGSNLATRVFGHNSPRILDAERMMCEGKRLLKGPVVQILNLDELLKGKVPFVSLNDHRARITSMRLFPLKETSLYRNEAQINENVLVTSSCDHSIRLWWKGSCQRCFRGHNGPVTILSDKLLGDGNGNGKVFASGGEDSTVRLWSLSSSGKRGQHALKATLYGHEKPIVLMSVTGHRDSLIVSMSKDSKARVWDASISSSGPGSSCVGMTSVPGVPLGMKCHDSLLYMAAGSSIEAVDLRTMRRVFRTSTNQGKLYSFDIMPSRFLACTGGLSRALLWDIRRSTGSGEADPMAELDGHIGPVTHLHMDPYKIVTGGPEDPYVNIWQADTGDQTNSLICSPLEGGGCCGLAADGFCIATAGYNQEEGVVRFRDFSNAACSGSSTEQVTGSKFWGPSTSTVEDNDTRRIYFDQ